MYLLLQKHLPVLIYMTIYSIFSLIGILCFVADYDIYLCWYEIFSGVGRPLLTSSDQVIALLLISFGAPLLFLLFFYLFPILFTNVWRAHAKKLGVIVRPLKKLLYFSIMNVEKEENNRYFFSIFYIILISYLLWEIFIYIDLTDVYGVYTNYFTMINARFHLFHSLAKWDWIFLYSFVPLVTGILYYSIKSSLLKYSTLLLSILLLMLTMQKRYILILLIFICLIDFFQNTKGLLKKFFYILLTIGMIFLAQTHFPAQLLTPVKIFDSPSQISHLQSNTNVTFSPFEAQVEEPVNSFCKQLSKQETSDIWQYLVEKKKAHYSKVFYYIFAIINRSSIPSIYYFEIFPKHHAFFGYNHSLFLPFKAPVDEGKIMWKFLNGTFAPDGAIAVPFNFSLYAYVGVWGTLLFSMMFGSLLGLSWLGIQLLKSSMARTIFSAIFCILMLFLAMDNFRAALFTCYGVFWWVICYVFLCFFIKVINLLRLHLFSCTNRVKSA